MVASEVSFAPRFCLPLLARIIHEDSQDVLARPRITTTWPEAFPVGRHHESPGSLNALGASVHRDASYMSMTGIA